MRETQNIREVACLNIDMMGFCFIKNSPRYVKMISSGAGIIPDYSQESLTNNGMPQDNKQVPSKNIQRVGVFADDMPQNIVTRVYNYHLDYVQLNGSENNIMIENLKRTLCPDICPNIGIIKKIEINNAADFEQCKAYQEGVVDLFLFVPASGKAPILPTALLNDYQGNTPFLLGGNIGINEVQQIRNITHPLFMGVDVNECFETNIGVKDTEKIKQFVTLTKANTFG